VESETTALREQVVEEREVQGRLLVGGRVKDGPLSDQGQPAHGRVVQVGVESDDIGLAGLHRSEERR
jgi:hypothetical protein